MQANWPNNLPVLKQPGVLLASMHDNARTLCMRMSAHWILPYLLCMSEHSQVVDMQHSMPTCKLAEHARGQQTWVSACYRESNRETTCLQTTPQQLSGMTQMYHSLHTTATPHSCILPASSMCRMTGNATMIVKHNPQSAQPEWVHDSL